MDGNNRKRKYSISEIYTDSDVEFKKQCLENSSYTENDSSQDSYIDLQNGNNGTHQFIKSVPEQLLKFMYHLDLSILCTVRKFKHKLKYPYLSLKFDNYESGVFNNINICNNNKSIYIQTEYVGNTPINNNLDYSILFAKNKGKNSLNNYFENFVKYFINKLDDLINLEYFVIYTNLNLELTLDNTLKVERIKHSFPFQFHNINRCDILQDFLNVSTSKKDIKLYQLCECSATKDEIIKRLKLLPTLCKALKQKNPSHEFEEYLKEQFINKLLFITNQPDREELNSIIRKEIKNSEMLDDYTTLKEKILYDFISNEKYKILDEYTSKIRYEFHLLCSFLHSMFINKKISFVFFEEKNANICSNIVFDYKNKVNLINIYYNSSGIMNYGHLFQSSSQRKNNIFSVNHCFNRYIEELKHDVRYFIIYTNANFDLTEEMALQKDRSKIYHPVKLYNMNINKNKYKIFKSYSSANGNKYFKFSKEETSWKMLMNLLDFPQKKENENSKFSNDDKNIIKEKFLKNLIFAVNQPNMNSLIDILKEDVNKNNKFSKVPYNLEELHEIALRWLESERFDSVTKEIMEKIIEDIHNNRSSVNNTETKNIAEELKFAKSVVGKCRKSAFNKLLQFLLKGDGVKYLNKLRASDINLVNVSSILHGAGSRGISTFIELYNLWFDDKGEMTKYLKVLIKNNVKFNSMSSMLNGSKEDAPKYYKDLFNLWFDENGNKTKYLVDLDKEEIKLNNMTSILSGSRVNCVNAYKDLYELWFDKNRQKSQYLKSLKNEGISINNITSILNGTGSNAAKIFKELYDIWFDADGNATPYLQNLRKEGITPGNMSSMLHATASHAPESFKDIYNLWFDKDGNKTPYLTNLQKENISISTICNIIDGSKANAKNTFQSLYHLWFDEEGNKTHILRNLENVGLSLKNMSGLLSGAGSQVVKSFKNLYNLWINEDGTKTIYLENLAKEGIDLSQITNILSKSGNKSTKTFKDLYNLLFDKEGNPTQYLISMRIDGVNFKNISTIISGARLNAADAFKDVHDLWFTKTGEKTQYLKTLENESVSIDVMSSIINCTGASAAIAFKDLFNTWFDKDGKKTKMLEHFLTDELNQKFFTMNNIVNLLCGQGVNAKNIFENLHNCWFDEEGNRTNLLDDFVRAGFTPSNLCTMLKNSGTQITFSVQSLHKTFFDENGFKTIQFKHFHNLGYTPKMISRILSRAGCNASSKFNRLYTLCLDEKGEPTKFLQDFYDAGFKPNGLSYYMKSLDKFEQLYNFCFVDKTKEYLKHFMKVDKDLTEKFLSKLFEQSGTNIRSDLIAIHDVCFDSKGNQTKILVDFFKAGFTYASLSTILRNIGPSHVSVILNNFHKSCFDERNYLDHFLSKNQYFTVTILIGLLKKAGLNICIAFEKLHNLCFDEEGHKTKYFRKIIRKYPYNVINTLDVKLYKNV